MKNQETISIKNRMKMLINTNLYAEIFIQLVLNIFLTNKGINRK